MMDQGESNKMTTPNSYPSPTVQSARLPFYTQQTPGDRDTQPHAPTAPMQTPEVDDRHFPPSYGQPQLSTPQQLAQQGLNMNQSNGDPESKKKQKVSRACDECRRKKIKCDAVEGDTSKPTCSACARSDTQCQFSRLPQKRGPSKGYIKELAERVQVLEHQSSIPFQPGPTFPADVNAYSPSPDFMGSESRKRTHSMTEGTQNFGPGFTPNMTSSSAQMPDSTFVFPGGMDPMRNMGNEVEGVEAEGVDDYYREMHIHLPVLPDLKSELQGLLEIVRKPVKNALSAAIGAAMHVSTTTSDSRPLEHAKQLLSRLREEELVDRNNLENLLVLQAYIFMITAREVSGPSKNVSLEYYPLAYAAATHLNLHANEEVTPQDPRDLSRIKYNGRRAWLVLVMLDRWHAASMVTPFTIPDENVWLLSSDRKLLGESAYDLIRLSLCVGHVAETLVPRKPVAHGEPSNDLLVARLIRGELERFREGAEGAFPRLRHVQVAYLAAKLLADRHTEVSVSNTKAIVAGAFDLGRWLPTEQNHASPLTHHFAALAAITLAEVLERDPTPIGDVLKKLESDLNTGNIQHPYNSVGNRPPWGTAIARFIGSRLDLQSQKTSEEAQLGGLQHLADAAVRTDGGRTGEETGKKLEGQAIDWTAMTRAGYLKLFE